MQNQNNSYNNADSFSMIFDNAWKEKNLYANDNLTVDQKIEKIIEDNKEHPFIKSSRSEAINVAKFRLRLLNLE